MGMESSGDVLRALQDAARPRFPELTDDDWNIELNDLERFSESDWLALSEQASKIADTIAQLRKLLDPRGFPKIGDERSNDLAIATVMYVMMRSALAKLAEK